MPTVSNHDILGPMAWGSNTRQEACAPAHGDNLLFGEKNFPSSCTYTIVDEHAYAGGGRPRFVSENGYYGYHPAMTDGANQDCSMDTGENNLSLGEHPNSCPGAFGGADVSNADQITWNPNPRRKRNYEPNQEMSEHASKRSRCGTWDAVEAETSAQSMVQGFGVPSSAPTIAEQSHSPAQMYDLPVHQLPGSTALLAPRPRCLMGHFI